jgi:hypothetical protein
VSRWVLTWCFVLWWLGRGMRDWGLLLPGSCRGLWRAGGQVKDRAQPGRGVPEASLRWPSGCPMIGAAGTGAGGRARYSVVSGRPMFRGSSGAGSAAGCIHPFACPRPWPGGMGRVRVRERSGGVNQMDAQPPAGGGRIACGLAPGGGQNAWRPRACAHG